MNTLNYNISFDQRLWGYTDILEIDLEQHEFDRNFPSSDEYASIIDEEPVYHSIMNFSEEDEDEYEDEPDANADQDSDADEPFKDRESYRETDMDNVYYLI